VCLPVLFEPVEPALQRPGYSASSYESMPYRWTGNETSDSGPGAARTGHLYGAFSRIRYSQTCSAVQLWIGAAESWTRTFLFARPARSGARAADSYRALTDEGEALPPPFPDEVPDRGSACNPAAPPGVDAPAAPAPQKSFQNVVFPSVQITSKPYRRIPRQYFHSLGELRPVSAKEQSAPFRFLCGLLVFLFFLFCVGFCGFGLGVCWAGFLCVFFCFAFCCWRFGLLLFARVGFLCLGSTSRVARLSFPPGVRDIAGKMRVAIRNSCTNRTDDPPPAQERPHLL